MKAKICGITQMCDAQIATQLGAWAIGFNFYAFSPRSISVGQARKISRQLGNTVLKIGIFVDEDFRDIQKIMQETELDLAQIYQDYALSRHHKQNLIFCVSEDAAPVLDDYAYVLFDASFKQTGLHGGSGVTANWDIAQQLAVHHSLILAGGLNPTNVRQAISRVKPFAIDVASGVEIMPGIKSHKQLISFMNEVKNAST